MSVLGGVVQDLTTITERLPIDGETYAADVFTMQPGGKGSSSAVAIHRLTRPNPKNRSNTRESPEKHDYNGVRVRMVGVVGKDKFGPALIDNLRECGINVDGVRTVDGQDTAVANILVASTTGANRILQYPGAARHVRPDDFTSPKSLGGGVVPNFMVAQLEVNRDAVEQAIETASNAGVEVLLKPSPAYFLMPEIYRMISHLIMNETEAFLLKEDGRSEDFTSFIESSPNWPDIADYFHHRGVKNVVITLGEKGAYYSTREGDKIQRGYAKTEMNCCVVDTSGAGYETCSFLCDEGR